MRPIRPQTVTLAVLAILFGLGAAWMAKQVLLAKRVTVQPAPPPPKIPLVILQSNLPADARIRAQDVAPSQESREAWEKIKETLKQENVPLDKVLQFTQQAVGRILKHAKPAASWLTEDDFYPIGKGPQLKLKEGYRAVNLRIDDPAVPGSIIQAGALVDVIFTTENPDTSTKTTLRLASALEVLGPPVNEGGAANTVTTLGATVAARKSYIVLAATPDQANRLALAQQMDGTISVTLCALPQGGDGSRLEPETVDALVSRGDFQIGERKLLNLPPRPTPPAPPERIIVEQFRGDKIDYVVFTDDNVRLTEEQARLKSLPSGKTVATAPAASSKGKCKNCEKNREKELEKRAREKANRENGEPAPVPDTPNPTPAPRST